MKQTAVEFLESKMTKYLKTIYKAEIEQSKEMHEQQIIDANNRGYRVGRKNIQETAQDYYNETYNTK